MKTILITITLFFAILNGVQSETIIKGPDPKMIQRHEWRMFPKPESIKRKGNKVIVVFDRKRWEAFQYMHRKMWIRRGEVHKQLEELKRLK